MQLPIEFAWIVLSLLALSVFTLIIYMRRIAEEMMAIGTALKERIEGVKLEIAAQIGITAHLTRLELRIVRIEEKLSIPEDTAKMAEITAAALTPSPRADVTPGHLARAPPEAAP